MNFLKLASSNSKKEITDNLVDGVSITNTAYGFVSNVTKRQEKHVSNTLEYGYTYDDRSRLLNVTASLNGATPITLKSLEYDDVGRLKKVKLHNNTTSFEYAYNIRSWLTGISGNRFSQSLTYGSYNGNITGMNWNANGSSHGYTFTYDGANRLLDAVHGSNHYTEKVTSYDKNGNIQGLQRYGQTGASSYGLVDNLTYALNGNQITKVEDAVSTSSYNGGTNFVNGSSTENEYTYDYNGNLTKDSNKGIADISWNSLNLPSVVTFADGSTVTYTYAADGTKLRTLHNINGTTTQTDYTGSVLYENGIPKSWLTEAGYISMDDSKYHYYLQDHQGNNRVVVSETGAVEEVNHYYAFGGLFGNNSSIQPFKYNGKELDTKQGLNWYDYGARQYDAALGRWFVVDPLAEEYYPESPYTYCGNNSINRIDSTGKDYWSTNNPDEIEKFWNWFSQNNNNSLDTYNFSIDLWFKMEDKEIIDAYKIYGQQALTYNGQTNKLYSSYVTYENGEIIVNGINTTAYINNTITLSSLNILTSTPSILPGFNPLNLNKNILSIIKNIIKNKQIAKKTIVFGQNGNQVYHTFRHIDKLNLSQDAVRKVIINDLKTKHSQIIPGKPFNQTVKVGNYKLQYTAYKLPNGKINIGRIHEVK